MKYIVIGLGNFGSSLAIELTNYGHEIIGVDILENRVANLDGLITSVFQLDATQKELLKMLPLGNIDVVIVSIGENFGASVQIIAQLRHLNVKHIYARAFNETHEMVLESLNIDRILTPEITAAKLIAATLYYKDVVSSLKLDDDCFIVRIKTPRRFIGFTVGEIDLLNNFNLNLITISTLNTKKNIFGIGNKSYSIVEIEDLKYKIRDEDILTIYGTKENFIRLRKAIV